MQTKWYYSALIVVLTLLGVSQQQISVPNQEIVVQFTNAEVSSNQTQNTVAAVKEQLLAIGVDNIQVKETTNGTLKIMYYSNADVASIKKALANKSTLNLDYTTINQDKEQSEIPSNKNTYNLDVHEIQKDSNNSWDLDGTFVAELKPDGNRFSNPKTFTFIDTTDVNKSILKVTYKVHYIIAIAIDNTSYKIPEIRAGPIA